MARERGPEGIHIAHVVVDSAIHADFILRCRLDTYEDRKAADGILNPESIAGLDAAHAVAGRLEPTNWTRVRGRR